MLSLNAILGCSSKKRSPVVNVVQEVEYCSTVTTVTNGVVISGDASYQYLKPVHRVGGISGLSLNPVGSVPYLSPIRRAEVRLLDSTGAVVQCGETDSNGHYSLAVEKPNGTSVYRLEINSRGSNEHIKASILDRSSSKSFYSIYQNVTINQLDTEIQMGPLVAPAKVSGESLFTKLEGGAFHIFDKILKVNEFLRAKATDSCNICGGFTVAPKVTVYWMMGFNPASYFNETSPLSFFDASGSIESTPSLYILGGSNGDVDSSDTDHFDESVIIHEYGHFLESHFWKTDSPGGFHNGNLIIDPRLAFSEGFANFLPSAVLGTSKYIDTIGSPYGETYIGVYLDIETEPPSPSEGVRDAILTRSPLGEGIYREVSVSRALWDYIDDTANEKIFDSGGVADNADETAKVPFSFIWLALTNNVYGLNSSNQHFVSMGHFNKALYQAVNLGNASLASGIDSARLGEFQASDTSQYAARISASVQACPITLSPVPDRSIGTGANSYTYTDLFMSSDFFEINHPGGPLNLKLEYSTSGSIDLDLYIYKEQHNLSERGDLVAASDKAKATEVPAGVEAVSVTLAAGSYLVLVSADSSSVTNQGPTANYQLRVGENYLCKSQ